MSEKRMRGAIEGKTRSTAPTELQELLRQETKEARACVEQQEWDKSSVSRRQ